MRLLTPLYLLIQLLMLLMVLHLGTRSCHAYNYCHNSTHLCNLKGLKHFICEKTDPYLNKTKYVATIPDTWILRKMVLSYFNKFRNEIASGTLTTKFNTTFKPASRMRELIWDMELAYTARMHAETVSFRHSRCRSVTRFPYAGEALALLSAHRERRTMVDIMDNTIKFMFESYSNVEDTDKLINTFLVPEALRFAPLTLGVNDRVSRVGCSFVVATDCQTSKKTGFCHFMTCHLDFINLANSYTYLMGEPTSECSTWKTVRSSSYENLCHNNGKIFPIED